MASESNPQLEDTLPGEVGALDLDSAPDAEKEEPQPENDNMDHDSEDGKSLDWFESDEEDPETERVPKVEEPEIRRRLTTFLKSKPDLAKFFSGDLNAETEKATTMANKLIDEEKCPDKEVAKELALLSLYDLVMLIGTLWNDIPLHQVLFRPLILRADR